MGWEGPDLGHTCFNFLNNIKMKGDLDPLINLYQSCFKESQIGRWSTKALQETLSQKSTYILLVYPGNNKSSPPIGFAIIQVVLDEAELLSLGVDPEWRGNGIGKNLLGELINQCKALKIKLLFLEVDEGNIPAISIYNRFDPVITGKRNKYYNTGKGDKKDALLMKINIGDVN